MSRFHYLGVINWFPGKPVHHPIPSSLSFSPLFLSPLLRLWATIGHMHKAETEMRACLRQVDVVIEVRDARAPWTSAPAMFAEYQPYRDKKRIVLFNKVTQPRGEIAFFFLLRRFCTHSLSSSSFFSVVQCDLANPKAEGKISRYFTSQRNTVCPQTPSASDPHLMLSLSFPLPFLQSVMFCDGRSVSSVSPLLHESLRLALSSTAEKTVKNRVDKVG
jgi:hypothetical protein